MATDQPWPSSPSVRSTGTATSSKKTSENSGGAVHGLDRPDGDARAVHVDEEGGDPPVGRLGRAGAGEQDATVGVLGQAGPHLLAVDAPDVAGRVARQDERGQVAAGTGLGEALAPGLVAPEEPWHHVGGQLRGCVVDHRRGQHLGHRVDARLDQVPRGERLAQVGPEQRGAPEPADPLGPSPPHPTGVDR